MCNDEIGWNFPTFAICCCCFCFAVVVVAVVIMLWTQIHILLNFVIRNTNTHIWYYFVVLLIVSPLLLNGFHIIFFVFSWFFFFSRSLRVSCVCVWCVLSPCTPHKLAAVFNTRIRQTYSQRNCVNRQCRKGLWLRNRVNILRQLSVQFGAMLAITLQLWILLFGRSKTQESVSGFSTTKKLLKKKNKRGRERDMYFSHTHRQ